MNLNLVIDKFELTDEFKEVIDTKFTAKIDHLIPNFNEEIKTANLHLVQDKYGKFKATFDITLPGKDGHIFSQNYHEDFIAVITGLREQVEKQIKKYKDII